MNQHLRMAWSLVAVLALATLVVPVFSAAVAAAQHFYPCSSCHNALNLTGVRKTVPFHGVDLTAGAHRGLYCSNCHVAPVMQELINGAEVYIPGLHSTEQLKETNKVCAVCHPQEFEDYQHLVHGNKTYTCQGGSVERIVGYKGVVYSFHICSDYRNLKTMPARACVECHDPHTPTMPPASILATPSDRPPAPDESSIAYGAVAAVIGGLILAVGALVLPLGYTRGK